MDKKKLLKLLRKDEGSKLDFKEVLNLKTYTEKKEFAKDVCALANSGIGRAYLIIGIRDKTKSIIGVSNLEQLNEEKIQQIISTRCDPPIPVLVENFDINKKKIVVITIFDGEQKPYQLRDSGAFYIRRGSVTDVMRKSEILNVFQERLDLNIETCPIVNANEKLLDEELISSYFESKGVKLDSKNRDFLLNSSNIVRVDRVSDDKRCTLGGLLVFSKINSIVIPYNLIKILDKESEEVVIIQGTLLDMIDSASNYIVKVIPKKYPVNAIIEAIKNAVLYRDYTLSDCIEIVIDKSEISVKNPGRFIESSDTYRMNYAKRNMWIYEKLITLDKEQRFTGDGQGFRRMTKMIKDIGSIKIEDSSNENTVKVIFPGVDSIN